MLSLPAARATAALEPGFSVVLPLTLGLGLTCVLLVLLLPYARTRRHRRRGELGVLVERNEARVQALALRGSSSPFLLTARERALVRAAASSPRPAERELAARLVAGAPTEESAGVLLRLLQDPAARVRRAALASCAEFFRDHPVLLGSHAGRDVVRVLAASLDDPDALPGTAVSTALSSWPSVAPDLARLLPRSPVGRTLAVLALGRLRDPATTDALADELSHPSPEVRAAASRSLGESDAISHEEELVRALADPVWWVRLHALRSLGLLGPAWAVDAVAACLDDEVDHVREAAALALADLGPPGLERLRVELARGGLRARRAAGLVLQQSFGLTDGLPDPELVRDLARAGVVTRVCALPRAWEVVDLLRAGHAQLTGELSQQPDVVLTRLAEEAGLRIDELAPAPPC